MGFLLIMYSSSKSNKVFRELYLELCSYSQTSNDGVDGVYGVVGKWSIVVVVNKLSII